MEENVSKIDDVDHDHIHDPGFICPDDIVEVEVGVDVLQLVVLRSVGLVDGAFNIFDSGGHGDFRGLALKIQVDIGVELPDVLNIKLIGRDLFSRKHVGPRAGVGEPPYRYWTRLLLFEVVFSLRAHHESAVLDAISA